MSKFRPTTMRGTSAANTLIHDENEAASHNMAHATKTPAPMRGGSRVTFQDGPQKGAEKSLRGLLGEKTNQTPAPKSVMGHRVNLQNDASSRRVMTGKNQNSMKERGDRDENAFVTPMQGKGKATKKHKLEVAVAPTHRVKEESKLKSVLDNAIKEKLDAEMKADMEDGELEKMLDAGDPWAIEYMAPPTDKKYLEYEDEYAMRDPKEIADAVHRSLDFALYTSSFPAEWQNHKNGDDADELNFQKNVIDEPLVDDARWDDVDADGWASELADAGMMPIDDHDDNPFDVDTILRRTAQAGKVTSSVRKAQGLTKSFIKLPTPVKRLAVAAAARKDPVTFGLNRVAGKPESSRPGGVLPKRDMTSVAARRKSSEKALVAMKSQLMGNSRPLSVKKNVSVLSSVGQGTRMVSKVAKPGSGLPMSKASLKTPAMAQTSLRLQRQKDSTNAPLFSAGIGRKRVE